MARYAANLGPVAWKIASKRIEYSLPPGVEYGPGWVADVGPPSNCSAGDCSSNKLATPSTSELSSAVVSEGLIEAVRKLNSQIEMQGEAASSSWRATPFPVQRNGFIQMYGYGAPAAGDRVPLTSQVSEPLPGTHLSSPAVHENWSSLIPGYPTAQDNNHSHEKGEMWSFGKSTWPAQHQRTLAGAPDLNVRIPAGSPSSSNLQIGSPQQPDLALQL